MKEKEFLQSYRASDFPSPLLTVDAILFTYHEAVLKVLLVKRSTHPDMGKWSLPGGFVDQDKDRNLEETIVRKLQEKTGVSPPHLEQLCTLGNSKRDKRGWSVTVCYSALMAFQDCEAHVATVSDVRWVHIEEAMTMHLAFDHSSILQIARERLKQKALYSIVPGYALPEEFTLPELQHLHEVIIGKPLQKKSFRRRIELADLLIDTGEKRAERGRPATLYRMKDISKTFTFTRNLEDQ
jgi:8-oxo-dGTP diphosphatase